jgi:hypothetical protein
VKLFNNVQELWNYCSFCPICQNNREISVSVGPDAVFTLNSFSKLNSILELQCEYNKRRNIYSVEYKIDCNSNQFEISVTNVREGDPETRLAFPKVEKAYFYFYIQSSCQQCNCSTAHGTDLELDVLERKVSNIALERETFRFLNEQDKFHISIIHDQNVMLVSRCYGFDREDEKSISLPIVKLDLSNQSQVINKIKTLILFS